MMHLSETDKKVDCFNTLDLLMSYEEKYEYQNIRSIVYKGSGKSIDKEMPSPHECNVPARPGSLWL